MLMTKMLVVDNMSFPIGRFIVHIDDNDQLWIDGIIAEDHLLDFPDDTLACIREMYELINSMHHSIIELEIKLNNCKGEAK